MKKNFLTLFCLIEYADAFTKFTKIQPKLLTFQWKRAFVNITISY